MKWLHAKKANGLIAVLLLSVMAAGYGAWTTLFPSPLHVKANVEGRFQLGFYDMMSLRKEIYDSSMRTRHGTVLSTITSPDDSRFVFKGEFTRTASRSGKLYYSLTPIYYATPQKGLMMDGLVDLLMHTHFWMMSVKVGNNSLAVGQSGSIFLYPPQK